MGHDETHFSRLVRQSVVATAAALSLACGRSEFVEALEIGAGGEAGAAPEEPGTAATTRGVVKPNATDSGGGFQATPAGSGDSTVGTTDTTTARSSGGTGAAGGTDAGSGSAAGGYGGSPQCTPDPRCEGKANGAFCQGHALTTCEDVDDDGCADFGQKNCAPGVCLDESTSCSVGSEGEACTDAIVVAHSGFVLSGADLVRDFGSDYELNEHEECAFGDADAADAVFAVALETGELLSVYQQGELESVIAFKTSCDSEDPCIDSGTGPQGFALEHAATRDETVYVIVEALQAAPTAASYEIHIDVDPECGNGIFEGGEGCDDGNALGGDGCSASCSVEFPLQCSHSSPSACSSYPSLGTAGANAVIEFPWETEFVQGSKLYYTVTFTERVLVDVLAESLTSPTGDINVVIYSDWDMDVVRGIRTGNDNWPGEAFEPGTYLVEFRAATTLPYGFHLTLTTHAVSCGDGVVVPAFEACDTGEAEQPGCEDCQIVFGWDCTGSPSVCEAIATIGAAAYSAGDPIEEVFETGLVSGYAPIYWLIEFDEDVLLNGTFSINGDTPGYFGYIAIWNESRVLVHNPYPYYDVLFADLFLPPGKYVIELRTFQDLPDGFSMTLETSAAEP